ncbi:MAG: hypothetical protein DRI57_31165, partial [Deltaproteobacteria bacterium]
SVSGNVLTFYDSQPIYSVAEVSIPKTESIYVQFNAKIDCVSGGDFVITPRYRDCCDKDPGPSPLTLTPTWKRPALQVEKINSGGPFDCGETIDWTIKIFNEGQIAADMVRAEDILATGLSFANMANPTTPTSDDFYKNTPGDTTFLWDSGTRTLTWEIGALQTGETNVQTYHLLTKVNNTNCANPEDRRNRVNATWHCTTDGNPADGNPDTDEAACTSEAVSTYSDANVTPNVNVNASISPSEIEYCAVNTVVTVDIEIPSTSNTLYDLGATITLPEGLKFYDGGDFAIVNGDAPATAPTVPLNPGGSVTNLAGASSKPSGGAQSFSFNNGKGYLADAVGSDTTIRLSFNVSSTCFAGGDIRVDLTYKDCCGTEYAGDASTTVDTSNPALDVTVTPDISNANCGTDVTYTITATNSGSASVKYARISAEIGEWYSYQSATAPTVPATSASSGPSCDSGTCGTCNAGFSDGTVQWEVRDLGAGESWSTELTLNINPPSASDCDIKDRQLNVTTQYGCPSDVGTWIFDKDACTNEDSGTCPKDSGTAVSQQNASDLVITSMTPTISCSDGTVTGSVAVTVKNQGSSVTSAGGFTLSLSEAGGWSNTTNYTGTIAAGASAVISVNLSGLSADCASCTTYDFEGTVDSDTTICECDETNNTFGPVSSNNCGSIGNYVWLDTDGDGVQDVGETGLSNVEINLRDSGNNIIATTKTDINGNYLFMGVFPGTYSVSVTPETVPGGLTNSFTPPGSITINPGDSYLDADFGYKNTSGKAIIGDTVWSDANGNGVQDSGEPGIGGVTLNLIGAGDDGNFGTADDIVEATVTTGDDGTYLFNNLDPDEYIVDVTDTDNVLTGYSLTGGSDPTTPITVNAGDTYLNADFGYRNTSLSSISDTVW